jgi:hypothetical protein
LFGWGSGDDAGMPAHAVRILAECTNPESRVEDAATRKPPFWWRGSSVEFHLALARAGQFLTAADIGEGEIIVEVKDRHAADSTPCLMRKTYTGADCDGGFDAAGWAAGSERLLTASFNDGEALLIAGTYRLIVRFVDADGEGNTYLSAEIRVVEDHSMSEAVHPQPDPPYIGMLTWHGIVTALPGAGAPGDMVKLASTGQYYIFNGTSWDAQSSEAVLDAHLAAAVQAAIDDLVADTPGTLELIEDLQEALDGDESLAAALTAAIANKVDKRDVSLETEDFSLSLLSGALIHRVTSNVPVVCDCSVLPLGQTAVIEWAGAGAVSIVFSGQILNANDKLHQLKERGSRLAVYRYSLTELQVLNPDGLHANYVAPNPPEVPDVIFELVANSLAASIYYDSRGNGRSIGQAQAGTSHAIDMTGGCAIAVKIKRTAWQGNAIESPMVEGNDYSRFVSGYRLGEAFNFRYNFGTAEDVSSAAVLGHDLELDEWVRFVVSVTAAGDASIRINGLNPFSGTVNHGTTSPGKLMIAADCIPGSMRVWDRFLSPDEINDAVSWLNAH